MQDGWKAVWSIPYVSVAFFPSLKQNFIAYRSSKVSDCIFEIHQLWQSGFSRVYSNCCCSCSFEPEIIKIGQSSYKMYSNNILNFQESTTILNACTKKSGNLLIAPCIYEGRLKSSHDISAVDDFFTQALQHRWKVLIARWTVLKNKPKLVIFHQSILVSRWTFQLPLICIYAQVTLCK